MNINIKATKENTYDAIVIGSGISGGWAAKELTEKGLKTLVLERGRMVEHVTDYPTALAKVWEFRTTVAYHWRCNKLRRFKVKCTITTTPAKPMARV